MKIVKTFATLFFACGLNVLLLGCNVAQNTGILGTSKSQSLIADKIVTDAPFAYDLVVDTISYNSCVGENLNSSSDGIPGLKIGVNQGFVNATVGSMNAGLKLNTEFVQYIGKNLKPQYPSTVVTPQQIQHVLQNSAQNNDAYLQIAVRKKLDLSIVKDLIQPTATSAIAVGRDGIIFYNKLSAGSIAENLTKNIKFGEGGVVLSEGSRIYNLDSPSSPVPIEATLGYSNITDETYPKVTNIADTENLGFGEKYSESVRSAFNSTSAQNKYLLTITYGPSTVAVDQGLSTPLRKDATKLGNAYGRSFALQFGYPADLVAAGWKNTALKQVIESNLVDGTPVASVSWTCKNYLIMKTNHWNNKKLTEPSCSPLGASDLASTTMNGLVKEIRRHYAESNWDVGLFYPANELIGDFPRANHKICLVPKKRTECYLPTQTVLPPTDVGVNYNPLTECYLYNRAGTAYTSPIDTVKANGRCAQFASICTR